MASESVSFRITRHTETLAETIHTLSQRLLKLEQRLTLLERQLSRTESADPAELDSLENVERLLQDCRQLLEVSVPEESDGGASTIEGMALALEEEGDEANVLAA
jgi:predicted  nucleic acid-binding Zn-ribbon protein